MKNIEIHNLKIHSCKDSEDEDLESDTLSSTGLLPKGNPGRFVRKLEDVVKKNPFSAYIESLTLDDIKLELAVIAGLLLYCFVHFVGRRRNTFIAKAW